MKKIFVVFLFFVMLFFTGCSSAIMTQVAPTMNSSLSFNFFTYTYTSTDETDVFYQTGKPYEDFVILYNRTQTQPLSEDELASYQGLLTLLTHLNQASTYQFQSLINLSSKELSDLALTYSFEITIEDIVTFNDLKTLNSMLRQDLSTSEKSITKTDYLEARTDISLTDQDIADLDLFQAYYYDINSMSFLYSLRLSTFEDLLQAFEGLQGVSLSADDIQSLQNAYDILYQLLNS